MRYIKSTLFIATCLMVASCRHDKSLFVNPNSPTSATPQTMLTEIEVATMNTYEGDLNRFGSIMVQHNVGANGQPQNVQVYSLPENYFDNQWGQIYQTLLTGKLLKENYGAANPSYSAIANILMAMNWGIATDCWGDIPFNNALQGSLNTTPTYDPQQVVLSGINSMLDSAIEILSGTPKNVFNPGSDDVIFGGDQEKWLKTAWTLKARYLNRLSNKSSYDPAAILTALGNGIQNSADDCMAIHGSGAQESNQWYAYLNDRAYMVAASTLVDSMKLRPTDLRLFYYFDSTGLGDIVGSPIDNTTDVDVSYWGSYLAGASETPTPLVTYFEAEFIKAEVEARQGAGSAAATDLNTAIMESCTKVTGGAYDGADIATYTAGNTTLGRVMYEKWIAMFGQMEAYNDYRRTKMPSLIPNPAGATSVIPQRYPTPQAERTSNPNAPVVDITSPVWWAKP